MDNNTHNIIVQYLLLILLAVLVIIPCFHTVPPEMKEIYTGAIMAVLTMLKPHGNGQ